MYDVCGYLYLKSSEIFIDSILYDLISVGQLDSVVNDVQSLGNKQGKEKLDFQQPRKLSLCNLITVGYLLFLLSLFVLRTNMLYYNRKSSHSDGTLHIQNS